MSEYGHNPYPYCCWKGRLWPWHECKRKITPKVTLCYTDTKEDDEQGQPKAQTHYFVIEMGWPRENEGYTFSVMVDGKLQDEWYVHGESCCVYADGTVRRSNRWVEMG